MVRVRFRKQKRTRTNESYWPLTWQTLFSTIKHSYQMSTKFSLDLPAIATICLYVPAKYCYLPVYKQTYMHIYIYIYAECEISLSMKTAPTIKTFWYCFSNANGSNNDDAINQITLWRGYSGRGNGSGRHNKCTTQYSKSHLLDRPT